MNFQLFENLRERDEKNSLLDMKAGRKNINLNNLASLMSSMLSHLERKR